MKKRGIVTVVLFCIILGSLSVNADWTTYPYLADGSIDCKSPISLSYTNNEDSSDCGNEFSSARSKSAAQGCAIGAWEHFTNWDDDCGIGFVDYGTVLGSSNKKITVRDRGYWEADDNLEDWPDFDSNAKNCLDQPMTAKTYAQEIQEGSTTYLKFNLESYVCGTSNEWYKCNEDSFTQFLDIPKDPSQPKADLTRFYCLKTKDIISQPSFKMNSYVWLTAAQVDDTVDADGVPAGKPGVFDGYLDCDDNNDKIFGKFDCKPKIDDKGKLVKGQEECSISNPEISGNTIDENCDGKLVTDADTDKDSCEKSDLNAAGVSYFWMPDAPKGSQCCGDDVDDFGKIFETESGPRLCLKKDAKSVGSVGKVEEIVGKTSCNGDWCAPLASSDNVNFHIFTIKQPGKESYDIVSNGEIWQKCNSENQQATLAKPIGDKAKVANGFSCYKEGDRFT